ncbi:MAG: hypothetical protein J6U40_00575 [Kiritimatiellae bacterium]|nr:hypothetical protein [Kiritimatiellia bacterium]MBP5226311.1 hypothetical protein [Kiritimatiellia bacterium]
MRLDEAFESVRHAFDCGRPANGYLIVGPVRGAAMDLAVKILQLLFCTADAKPCGVCDACRHVRERTVADIHWLVPESKSRIITIEQMHNKLLEQVLQTSLAGGWKAGVIVGADRLRTESANAFLKTLEEPPPQTIFLLLTDAPQGLLPTIISRCQRIDLTASSELAEPWKERVLDILDSPLFKTPMERQISANFLCDVLNSIKAFAEDEVKRESKSEEELVEVDDAVFAARVNARYREIRTDLVLTLESWFRDLFILRAGGDPALIRNRAYRETLEERARKLTLAQTLYNINAIEELAGKLELNVSEDSLIGFAIDRLNHGV